MRQSKPRSISTMRVSRPPQFATSGWPNLLLASGTLSNSRNWGSALPHSGHEAALQHRYGNPHCLCPFRWVFRNTSRDLGTSARPERNTALELRKVRTDADSALPGLCAPSHQSGKCGADRRRKGQRRRAALKYRAGSVRRHRVKQHFPPAVIEAAIEAKAEAVANGDDAASLVKPLRNAIVMLGQRPGAAVMAGWHWRPMRRASMLSRHLRGSRGG